MGYEDTKGKRVAETSVKQRESELQFRLHQGKDQLPSQCGEGWKGGGGGGGGGL